MKHLKEPLVSIGLPVFNGADHFELAVKSILEQSYQNIELIISDNGSTDGTARIAKKFASQDSRIKFIKNNENIGVLNNFNLVLQQSSGRFFMWAASDDLHSQNFVEECVNHLIANPKAVLCQTRVAVCLENPEQVIYYSNLNSFKNKTSVEMRYKETLYNFPAVSIYGMYRTKLAKSIPGFRDVPGGDLLWVEQLSLTGNFIQCEKTLFKYIARAQWNSFESDLKNLSSTSEYYRNPIFRAIDSIYYRIKSIKNSQNSNYSKARLMLIAVQYSARTVFVRSLLKLLGIMGGKRIIRNLKHKMFWKFLHNPNTEIVNHDLFETRIINPTVGII